ncbi:hypothetical protein [Nocardioides terrisoli]|uniref:hypothetical protein n=1 Tax=Nocardioides terrisoli TaxID=3388267 RepID=UPI00287BC31F|nr:hypothetical protein [Nocardioides marmorisolisilvae]
MLKGTGVTRRSGAGRTVGVGIGKAGLLQGAGERVAASTGTWLGALFESLVAQSVRVYASAHVGRLRTKETDLSVR